MQLAVIETGSKQYLVQPGSKIEIDKIKNITETKNIIFDKVLLIANDNDLVVGKPFVVGARVTGSLIKEKKRKIKILKYKPKTRYRKNKGYKQTSWLVEIHNIEISK
ncbi:MAG: 50S ribosomal protein L21 [Candidatus Parcubacteria bacterium]|nr:MAG: 50S ribosomal protein L21 [Candidatus Parcubacteria bacterium]